MPAVVESMKSQSVCAPPPAQPLDESLWRAWVARGRAQDRRSSAARMMAVKWVSIAALLTAAGLWSRLEPLDVLVRFLVTGAAIAVMFQAFQARQYALGVVFAALALFYNPVAPMFDFSGNWQRALVVASAAPFVASLAWPMGREARTESE